MAHTPGPWRWFGNRHGGVYLATTHSGRQYVMGFKRYGMNGAQPLFRDGNIMRPASELVEFEVGDGTARGFKQADKDGSVYRYDVSGIDSADARLIEAAPTLLEALQTITDDLEAEIEARRGTVLARTTERDLASVRKARAAISLATGETS